MPLVGLPLLLWLVHLVWLELTVHPVCAPVFESEPPTRGHGRRAHRAPSRDGSVPAMVDISPMANALGLALMSLAR
jgi:hypothetical protein